MKNERRHSTSTSMVAKLIMRLLVIVTALVGAPAVQAAAAMPCDTIVTVAQSRVLSSTQAPSSAPCNTMTLGCAEMLGCGQNANLPVRVATATRATWRSIAYWSVPGSLEGLLVKPDLGPPITI